MIGVLSAMFDEVDALLNSLQNTTTEIHGKTTFYKGSIGPQELVIAFSGWGKVAATHTATQLISLFPIEELIFTGVTGALDAKLNIGDIVLATNLAQHDMDASPLFPKYEIPLLETTRFSTNENTELKQAIQKFAQTFKDIISTEDCAEFYMDDIQVYQGTVLTGDEFINDPNKVKTLKTDFPDALCIEMEGAAVAQVCSYHKMPLQVIRTVSDKANDDAPIDFPKFTKAIASQYAKAILENYCHSR